MSNNVRQLTTQVRLNGTTIPVLSWKCHLTSYGNLCTFEVTTSIKKLKSINYEIYKEQQANPIFECQIIILDSTQGSSQIIFDGIVDTVEGTWESDEIEIAGRDYSAVLRDKIETLDAYLNLTVSEVVQKIADNNQLLSLIQISPVMAGIKASTFQGEDWAISTAPRPVWHIIQQLADEAGYVAFIDQHKTLHFEDPGSGKTAHTYYWRPTSSSPDITNIPIMKLSMLQQSRRCNNFTLRIHGYDRDGKETVIYEDKVGDGTGMFKSQNRPDINAQNAKQIWTSIADEIQRKNLVVKMIVDGDSSLNINDQVKIQESYTGDLLGLANRELFIVSIVQSFTMPDYGSAEGDGFLTHITCNQMTGGVSP